MTPGRFAAIAVAAVVVAFGAAFAVGKATSSGGDNAAAPSAVTPVSVPATPKLVSFSPSGSLPAQAKKKAPKRAKRSTPAPSSSPAPSTSPTPSTPAPAPTPTPAPAPAPTPAPAPSGGGGGGSGGGGGGGGGGGSG